MSNTGQGPTSRSALTEFAFSLPEDKAVKYLFALGAPDPDLAMEDILTKLENDRYLEAKKQDQLLKNGTLLDPRTRQPVATSLDNNSATATEVHAVIHAAYSVEYFIVPHMSILEKKYKANLSFKRYGQEIKIVCPSSIESVQCQLEIWDIIGQKQQESRCLYKPEIVEYFRQMSDKDRAEFFNTTKVTFKIIERESDSMILVRGFNNYKLEEIIANIESEIMYSVVPDEKEEQIPQFNPPVASAESDNSRWNSIFGTHETVSGVQRRLEDISITSPALPERSTILESRTLRAAEPVHKSTTPVIPPSVPTPRRVNFAPDVDTRSTNLERSADGVASERNSDCISLNASDPIIRKLMSEAYRLEKYLERHFGTNITITKSFGGLAIRLSAANENNLLLAKEYIWENLSGNQQMQKVIHGRKFVSYWFDLSKQERIIFFSKTEVTVEVKDLNSTPNLALRAFNELALDKAYKKLDELIKYSMKPSHLP